MTSAKKSLCFSFIPRIWFILFLTLAMAPARKSLGGTPFGKSYLPAKPGYAWLFPRDFGSHPDYQTEWWYYTGHLQTEEGNRYGFELTFFRVGLDPAARNTSSFAAKDLYFAHFAVSDLKNRKFWYEEKMNRPGPGLAGAKVSALDTQNEDWRVLREGSSHHLTAQGDSFGLDLKVQSTIPVIFHGIKGYSRKGSSPGNVSQYFSLPLLLAQGTLRVGAQEHQVSGKAWMDHEFFSGKMDPDETGWDWFGLQFSDSTELMLYRVRMKDGAIHPASSGTYVDAKGKFIHLDSKEIQTEVLKTWKSSRTGAVYPIQWKIGVPSLHLDFETSADFPDQELDTTQSTRLVYWEGSISVRGKKGSKPLQGEGYMELTGYDQKFNGF